ncbi:hypothetical protein ACS0TY_005522 [Phlomoides rotata]
MEMITNNDSKVELKLIAALTCNTTNATETSRTPLQTLASIVANLNLCELVSPIPHKMLHVKGEETEKENTDAGGLGVLALWDGKWGRQRIVGVKLPTIEIRYSDLCVAVECEVVDGKPLPTLWNSLKSLLLDVTRLPGLATQDTRLDILNDVNGIIKPGRYNGYKLDEFVAQKSSAYTSQHDVHIPKMTVRETLDFSARCQGTGSRAEIMREVSKREKEANIVPDPDIDTYMKAIYVQGQKTSLQTDYILKILGLDVCADTPFGDTMTRGVSSGQKKRLTIGEMIVGPTRALFMDAISNGLDSSTTYQIVSFLQQLAHITDATIVVSLLQPTPETFDLFDDLILIGEGKKIIYHGPRSDVLDFFSGCGFRCPQRKGVADFLQEVISKKDQKQYWDETGLQPYRYTSVDMLAKKYKESVQGKKLSEELSVPFDNQLKKKKKKNNAISFKAYNCLPKWALFRACMSREFLLMKRNSFLYVFKSVQLVLIASITMTVFLRTDMGVDIVHANNYMGALFYSLLILLFDGMPELSLTVARLTLFYKQRDFHFYPTWAYVIPATILKIPLSFLQALLWTSLTYFVIGYTLDVGRFFRQLVLLFAVHMASISMFRFLASVFRTVVAATTAGSLAILFVMLFSGFMIPRPSMPVWLKWAFWLSPLSYGEIGLSCNEFLAPRWQKEVVGNTTLGHQTIGDTKMSRHNIHVSEPNEPAREGRYWGYQGLVLTQTLANRGLNFGGNLFWVSVGALFGLALLFNIGFILALTYLKPSASRPIISSDQLSKIQASNKTDAQDHFEASHSITAHTDRIVLPFGPLSIVFQDVQYYVETPVSMKEHGFTEKRIQLLRDITAAFRPGVLTALMGVSGAGKTTLLDVLSGRKTSGTIEGEIRIGGFPKVQTTFARISSYCEQTDIHSPQITVQESVLFSAWLRLDPHIESTTKYEFVKHVLERIELDSIKDALVGLPGVDGLSTEQRKRLTIAVELVSNPSIIFMDEPTTGLDARAAAVVMRAVKNVANTGRTILLLLKAGGRMSYYGPLGQQSCKVIEYFEGISGVPRIRDNYNPAAWMLEVTSASSEIELSIDFAEIYSKSSLQENNKEVVKKLSKAPSGSTDVHFATRYAQNGWGQFKACLWKQHLSYWRSPKYNLMQSLHMLFTAFIFGVLFWGQGKKIDNQQSLFTLLGSMYASALFCGINNSSSVLPYVSTERSVVYRERFAGMYASWAYSAAQVVIEIPYLFAQAVAFTAITYPMIGYYWSAYKVLWYLYTMFCTVLYVTYLGMMLVSITPSFPVAAILQSAFYTMLNLFSGFLIPHPQIPRWWIWFYYVVPNSWSLNGMLTSQFGVIHDQITMFG